MALSLSKIREIETDDFGRGKDEEDPCDKN